MMYKICVWTCLLLLTPSILMFLVVTWVFKGYSEMLSVGKGIIEIIKEVSNDL